MNLPAKQEQGLIRSTISGNIQIRHLKNSVPIEQGLMQCFKLVGLREKHFPSTNPEYNEKQFLVDHIRENYAGLVADEIILAFKLLVQRKLNVDEKQISPYDNFSPEYLGRVLSAYNEFKAKELQTPIKMPLKEIKQTPEQIKQFWNRFLFDPYNKILAGESYPFDEYQGADRYTMLEMIGVKMSNPEITEKFKNLAEVVKGNGEYKRKKLNKLRRELKSSLFKQWLLDKAIEEEEIKEDILSRL